MSYQREYERKLKVGLVGAGSHAYRNLLPLLTYLPVELNAICDIDEGLARKTAAQYGAEAVYTSAAAMYERQDLEAVLISVSPRLHPELASGAFDAGLHVWMEKPPSIRAKQVEEMLAHRGDRVCVVGFKKAFTPAADKVVEILGSDEFGPLKSMVAVYNLNLPTNGKQLLDEGTYTNNLCHPLALMMRVGGDISAVTTHRAKLGGGCVVFEFRRGIPFEYSRTTSYAPPGMDHGAVSWVPQNNVATLENKALFTQGFWSEMKYFCDCILEHRDVSICSLEFALRLMQVHESVLLSGGNRVELPELDTIGPAAPSAPANA